MKLNIAAGGKPIPVDKIKEPRKPIDKKFNFEAHIAVGGNPIDEKFNFEAHFCSWKKVNSNKVLN